MERKMYDELQKSMARLTKQMNDLAERIDRNFSRQCADNADATTDVECAVCDMDISYDERMTAIEDALCELDTKGV